MPVRPDPITWKQIGVGYVILLCIGLGAAAAMLDPQSSSIASEPLRSVVAFAVFAVLYGIWRLLAPPLSRAATRLAPTTDGQLRLKRGAVAVMWSFSVLLCLALVRVTQVVNPW